MGLIESSDYYETILPPPPRATLYVMRNGRYEPQNLMPTLPRPDIFEFDGFVSHRGNGQRYMNGRPPEMRQATLIDNPVSIRRDSARIMGSAMQNGVGLDHKSQETHFLTFTFDARRGGQLSVHLLVREYEKPMFPEDVPAEETQTTERSLKRAKKAVPRTIELLPQEFDDIQKFDDILKSSIAKKLPSATVLDSCRFDPGVGQTYESPAFDISSWPAERLSFSKSRPKDIPVAVRLDVDAASGDLPSITHYSYISLPEAESPANKRPAQVFTQKMQYGVEPFVLHEMWGAAPTAGEMDDSAQDCVICLSEQRDTAVLPCRHMCFCQHCAGIVRLQCDRCPVCRQKVQALLQFKRSEEGDEEVAATDAQDPFLLKAYCVDAMASKADANQSNAVLAG